MMHRSWAWAGILLILAFSSVQAAQEASVPDVVEKVVPAVVSIYAQRPAVHADGSVAPFLPMPRRDVEGMGSGVIVRADGLIVTNNHVVDQARDLRVVLHDRREFRAKIVGRDPKTDIALLQVDGRDLPHVPFGDSSKVRVGETVLAIGNPLGVGQTVSKGIVSAKGRANVGIVDYEDFLQTDAAINPGNSGGALVNLRGELVGINTAIATRTGGFQGIGFAIPSNMAREVMEILLREGRVDRGQLGVLVQDITPALAEALRTPGVRGVLVSEVMSGGAAEKAGLRRGDVILKVDGADVDSSAAVRNRVALRGAGRTVTLRILREGKTLDVEVRLKKLEEPVSSLEPAAEAGPDESAAADSGLPGISVAPATPSLLRRFQLSSHLKGLVVTRIDVSKAPAWAGLVVGDVIVEVNRRPVRTVDDLREALESQPKQALLCVRRGNGTLYLAVPRPSPTW